MTYEELVSIVQTVVKYDVNKYIADLQSISIIPGITCRTFIRNDVDVLFMLEEDRVIPQVCVSLIERAEGGVIGEDIPPHDNTQHFRSSGGSNQLFTERSGIDGRENLCGVPPEVVDHGDIVGAQLDDDFGYHIEMNMYNDMNNERNNERNNEPHNLPIHEVANEPNFHPVHNVVNNEEDEEPFERESRARRVHRCSSTAVHIAGTSEVRPDVTPSDSENARTWVIPGAESYSFGMDGSRNLVEDEPTRMIYKGQFFPTKKDLKRLDGYFAMRHNFEWKVKRSNKTTLHLVFLMDNCTWKLRAVRRDEDTYLQVRSFINEHTCPLEEIHRRHRQTSVVIIGEVVAPRLQQQDGRLMRPKDIIVDMKTMYGIQIMYSKAHEALDYALSLTYGTHEESFQLLPSFGYVLEQQNPGTITDLQCDENVRGFQRCMHQVIAVDGTYLKGRFGGTMFVAIAQDGNEQVYPIAFGYSDSKNNLSWEWFFDCLKGVLGHIDDLVFISDRHASIEAGISKHFYENIKKRYHRKDVAVIMDKVTRAYTELQYTRHMEELRNLHPNVYEYVIDAEFIRNMLQRWFHDRYRAAQSMRHQLTDASHLVILKRVDKCNFKTVNPVDWNIFSVKWVGKQWTVDLARKTCTCNKFQMDLLPCSHTLAAVRDRNMDFTSLCADYYKRQTLIDA
ncbi:hypothetical protein Ddye_021408 [Dipteronia dyeriana]|uniref:SWIM-type domain-containing protein n=1 Tax=Dipteronia dyeriana TaxID=168575 RepID=A0AAD9U213_9ROSI|nr:hypothetical protein Ddye_021408 [Dipteronia dyeriana]